MSGDGQTTPPQEPKKKNKAIIILIILLVIVIAAAGIIIYFLLNKKDKVDDTPLDDRGTVVTKDNVDQILNAHATEDPDARYTTSMSIDWHFKGKTSTDAFVENATENQRTVYFDIVRADNNEMIYSSPYIPVGEQLNGVTLEQELETGTYDTILTYHLVDDDNEEICTVSVELTIFVE